MSFEATKWVLESAPNLPPHLAMTLVALAWHADKDGCKAYPSQATLAKYTRKSERAVRNDLAQLLELGLIRRGDQRAVEHIVADARPAVYDVAIGADGSGGKHATARKSTSARKRGTGRKHSSKGSGSTDPVAGGSTLPPKVVPTELQAEPPLEPPLPTPPASPGETVGQRVNRLTRTYTDCVKLSNFPAVAGVVRKAVSAGVDDEKITDGLAKLAADNRAVTTDSLRYAIYGVPPSQFAASNGRKAYRNPEDMSVYEEGL